MTRDVTTRADGNPLAPYWHWLNRRRPTWWNHRMMFGGPSRKLTIDGVRWSITFNIHITRRSRRAGPYASAGLSVVPPTAKAGDLKRIRRGGWVQVIGKQLREYGYSGGWRDSRWGGAAMWFKDLGNLAGVKMEEARIPAYNVPAWINNWKRASNK